VRAEQKKNAFHAFGVERIFMSVTPPSIPEHPGEGSSIHL
jgi:hypothetical protein